jgi:hypothetical protein
MSFLEILNKMKERKQERKDKFHELDENDRLNNLIETRKKPSNERELEQFMEKERQKRISELLEQYRRKERDEINFAHNPINAPNITNKSDFNLLKEKKLFNKGNMFVHNPSVLNGSKKLLSNGRIGLCR